MTKRDRTPGLLAACILAPGGLFNLPGGPLPPILSGVFLSKAHSPPPKVLSHSEIEKVFLARIFPPPRHPLPPKPAAGGPPVAQPQAREGPPPRSDWLVLSPPGCWDGGRRACCCGQRGSTSLAGTPQEGRGGESNRKSVHPSHQASLKQPGAEPRGGAGLSRGAENSPKDPSKSPAAEMQLL